MEKKWFTLDEANALLPTIRRELDELQTIRHEFEKRFMQLKQLKEQLGTPRSNQPDPYFTLESELEFMQIEARTLVQSIHMKGAQLKDLDMGLVDFPSLRDGEEVLLCWRLGEDTISYWHGVNDGYSGRRRIE
ncbi:DUF2203 domain-containing protein [Paenibacillus ginsengarvi]|uniref:DUF2203 family protein n=1 Tax=Paenibacillus ginsengarvi TaxID=400777 RepID=A0A3B0B005_9BACL|nr:DUF2203 domain-containing protein [Paenibacillus ginsengarvi]RKN66125.1 DUF2203 family protein [Paenibacillus ginsengarvi]